MPTGSLIRFGCFDDALADLGIVALPPPDVPVTTAISAFLPESCREQVQARHWQAVLGEYSHHVPGLMHLAELGMAA